MTTKGRYDSARQWRTACRNVEVAKELHRVSAIRFIEEWSKDVIYNADETAFRDDLDQALSKTYMYGLGAHELPDLFDAFNVKPGDFDELLTSIAHEVELPDGLQLVFTEVSMHGLPPYMSLMIARMPAIA